uniref:Uncharacterized protein n=1 Tax=Trichobilharzia regenti TaxID=157069 RepID=A0AA85K8S8_TRIRE|nr:unnamed protein product [Trichobilharzia regenti]
MSSPEPEDNDFQFVHQTELRSLQYISRENNVVNDEASENNESGGHLVVPQSTNESTQLQRFQTNNPRPFGESSSSQIFKHHLKKLHVAVNKILEVDRSSKHKSLSKKNFKSNQEAYDKMLDAVRELGSFVVQRQNAPSSSGDHSRTLEEMKFRFSKRVRSKSTTYDDPISHGLSPSSKTKHLPKSTRRTTSLTKRSKSPNQRSASSHPVSNSRQSYHAKQLNNIENVKILHHAKTTYKVPTSQTINTNTDPVTENVVSTQKCTDPENSPEKFYTYDPFRGKNELQMLKLNAYQ